MASHVYATMKNGEIEKMYATEDAAIRDRMDWLVETKRQEYGHMDDAQLRIHAAHHIEEYEVLDNY